jgi:hypothetical protein
MPWSVRSPCRIAPAAPQNWTRCSCAPQFTPLASPGIAARRAYRAAWRQFETWWTSLGREPLAANADAITMVVRRADDFTDKFGTH